MDVAYGLRKERKQAQLETTEEAEEEFMMCINITVPRQLGILPTCTSQLLCSNIFCETYYFNF
jgi:hypothetical protein